MKKLLRKDLLSMGFYEKSRFTGSIGQMNYILEKSQKEGEAPLLLDMTDFLNTEAEKFNEESFEQF